MTAKKNGTAAKAGFDPKTQPIVSISKVSKQYKKLKVLSDVDLDIFRGDVVAIIGPSGAGKHDRLTSALRENGAEVIEMESSPAEWTNLLFTRDTALVVPSGAILSRFSMFFRQGETPIAQRRLAGLGMPILGAV